MKDKIATKPVVKLSPEERKELMLLVGSLNRG